MLPTDSIMLPRIRLIFIVTSLVFYQSCTLII